VWGLWRWHFGGAESDGHVVVYQGLPWNVVGSVKLYRPVYVSPLLAAQLSQAERQELFDHSLRSDASARAVVRRYEEQIGAGCLSGTASSPTSSSSARSPRSG